MLRIRNVKSSAKWLCWVRQQNASCTISVLASAAQCGSIYLALCRCAMSCGSTIHSVVCRQEMLLLLLLLLSYVCVLLWRHHFNITFAGSCGGTKIACRRPVGDAVPILGGMTVCDIRRDLGCELWINAFRKQRASIPLSVFVWWTNIVCADEGIVCE